MSDKLDNAGLRDGDIPEDEEQQADSTALSLQDTSETPEGEGGKFKMIVQLFKRCLGVKDIAAL